LNAQAPIRRKMKLFKKLTPFSEKSPREYPEKIYTYFVPAPPRRKHGYREKAFDKLAASVIARGFKIVSVHTESLNTDGSSGIWIILILMPLHNEAAQLDLDELQPYSLTDDSEIIYEENH
jgi:hypothetical protein